MKKFIACILAFIFALTPAVPFNLSSAQEGESLELLVGDLETLEVQNMTRISVTDPSVADISDAQSDKVLLLGKKSGQTVVFIWDDSGKRSIAVRVFAEDLENIKSRVQNLLNKSDIRNVNLEVSPEEGRVIASGALSKKHKDDLDKILEPYSDSVLNLTREEVTEDLVQVDMQIIELNTSFEKDLGINWVNALDGDDTDDFQLKYAEDLPDQTGEFKDLFKIGDFSRSTPMVAKLNAMVRSGKGRILSKPRLVALSGKEASFLVGGEVPISSTTSNATGNTITENTTFKQYGVNLTVTPTVREGKIDVLLNVEVSDIDSSKGTFRDLAFITRTAQTTLYLDNGQTIVLAGLIKHNDGESVKEVPFLGKIPVLGALFRNRRTPTPNGDTELVVILTPTILKDKRFAKSQTVMPTANLDQFSNEIESKYKREAINLGNNPAPSSAKQGTTAKMVQQVVVHQSPNNLPYASLIQEKISRGITYPYEALRNNWQGTVKLKLHILKDGTLATATVTESSGYDVFDRDALNTAKIAAPYPSFSEDMSDEDLVVTVPIVYSQGMMAVQ